MSQNLKSLQPIFIFAPGMMAGAERVVLTGLKALLKQGLLPQLILIKETRVPIFAEEFQKFLPREITVSVVESERALDFYLAGKIKRALKTLSGSQPVIHTHGMKALVAYRLAKLDWPHVHTHHGDTGHTFKVRAYEYLARRLMRTCHRVIAVSEAMKLQLQKFLTETTPISVVENMLSFENASLIREQRKLVSLESSSVIRLLFVGRLSPEKALLDFIQVWAVHDLREKFHLTVLGDGPEKDRIKLFVAENNLNAQIAFLGFVKDPSIYFLSTDLLIMPSLREGLPMTLIESLAVGVPVMANDVGAISSLLQHQKNGYLVSSPWPSGWNKALTQVSQGLSSWCDIAQKQAVLVEKKYSSQTWAKKTASIYFEILSKKEEHLP